MGPGSGVISVDGKDVTIPVSGPFLASCGPAALGLQISVPVSAVAEERGEPHGDRERRERRRPDGYGLLERSGRRRKTSAAPCARYR